MKLTKRQVDILLNLLDTLSSLDLTPAFTVIWEVREPSVFDMRWNILRPRPNYVVSIRDKVGTMSLRVIDVRESD